MLKVIELDIDGELTGDTGVWEIAWVNQPAIEQDFIFFNKQEEEFETYNDYPEGAKNNACRALKWRDEHPDDDCGTPVGWARANQLCKGENISRETIARMASFERHRQNSDVPYSEGCGGQMWDAWGGDSGISWAQNKLKEIDGFAIDPNPCWDGYEPVGMKPGDGGGMVPNCVKMEKFVKPNAGESQDDFIGRCIPYLLNEGKTQDEAAGACYGMWEGSKETFAGDKVSFDWDGTLDTKKGIDALERERVRGSEVYIITARPNIGDDIWSLARKYDIPSTRIYATGSNPNKIDKIKEVGIVRHYDDNPRVQNELPNIAVNFDYDISGLPSYVNYPESGDTDSMLVKPLPTQMSDCGCNKNEKHKFELVGFIDGTPTFSNPDEARLYGNQIMGCDGYHEHDVDGEVVYMPCALHPIEEDFSLSDYDEEEIQVLKLLSLLKVQDYQKFEAITNQLMRGFTAAEIKDMNHKNPVKYFLYKRVMSGSPDRDFCTSIEGRYFRRLQIDALRDTNTDFGHNKQPYSKWLYKGGPNCVHAWEGYIAQGKNLVSTGMAEGNAGVAPKAMPNNGYFDEKTKRKSEIAYIISQQNMSEQKMESVFKADEQKRMVYSPLMIPNILIPRIDEVSGERFYVKFTPETIEKIQRKFMIEQRLRDTNYEHTDKKFSDAVLVESWLVEGEKDKAYQLGFTSQQTPVGTWMGGFKILDTEEGDVVWNELIKTGKVKGMSVEGNFITNFSQVNQDEYLLEQIKDILKKIDK